MVFHSLPSHNFVRVVPAESEGILGFRPLFISTSKNENFGHTIVESLATGLPILISENCPWNNLEKYNAGFRLPLTNSLFKEKLIYFNEMKPGYYREFNNGSRNYYDKFVNPSIYKNGYIKMFS